MDISLLYLYLWRKIPILLMHIESSITLLYQSFKTISSEFICDVKIWEQITRKMALIILYVDVNLHCGSFWCGKNIRFEWKYLSRILLQFLQLVGSLSHEGWSAALWNYSEMMWWATKKKKEVRWWFPRVDWYDKVRASVL